MSHIHKASNTTHYSSREGGKYHMTIINTWLSSLLRKEDGQGLAEYALILALIAVFVIGAVTLLGGAIGEILGDVAAGI